MTRIELYPKHSSRVTPSRVDSVERIVNRLAKISKEPVLFNSLVFAPPSQVCLSPTLVRDFTCVSGCSACCSIAVTLDYLDSEVEQFQWNKAERKEVIIAFKRRSVTVNGTERFVWSYPQYADNRCPWLRNVRPDGNLGCSLWTNEDMLQPLECASSPNLSFDWRKETSVTYIKKRPFGRASQWANVPQCEFDPGCRDDSVANELKVLRRYKLWAETFELNTYIDEIIAGVTILPRLVRSGMTGQYQVIEAKGLFD